MARVFIPPALRPLADDQRIVDVDGSSVRQIIRNLDARFPGIHDRLCETDKLRTGWCVCVSGSVASLGLLASVKKDDEIHFLPAVGGG